MLTETRVEERHRARLALIRCREAIGQRDALIQQAAELGIPKSEIAELIGLNRSYIYELLEKRTI